MERVFAMPDLGEGLEEGRVVEWLVAVGDEVALNQPLVEVETAKATVEIPSPFAGRIATLHSSEGEDVPVGAALVTFDVEGSAGSASGTASLAASPLGPDGPGSPAPPPENARVAKYSAFIERRPDGGPARATPLVRNLAKEVGVDIDTVRGSGPDGRVIETDVRRVAERIQRAGPGAVAVNVSDDLRVARLEPDAFRQSIAETLTRQAQIPQVTTFRSVDCTALEGVRAELGVSPLPVCIAVLCRVIQDHPLLNARWIEDAVELRGKVNVGIAIDTPRGLVVPVLQDTGRRGITDISGEIRRLAEAAREGTIAIEDLVSTTTIAVSNTGSYGSEAGTPILSPGTSVTLAFGVIQPRALVVDGEVVARAAATISMTFDHRVLDGAAAGRALTDLVALLESPERLGGLPR
jgi:2-oxoisovalerate dehydrogenase E2 component (dihydrolipoyl transacylase)